MPPKIALVTGSSRGLGQALASLLSKDGYIVICAQRSIPDEENDFRCGENVRNVYLDLRSERSIGDFSQRMKDELPYLNILVNNAGICPAYCPHESLAKHWRSIMRVNFFGPISITEQLLPLLRRCPDRARVVNISSGDGELLYFGESFRTSLEDLASQKSTNAVKTGINSLLENIISQCQKENSCDVIFGDQPAYKFSKAALNVYTRVASRSKRFSGSEQVEFVAVCPGDVDTDMADDDVPLISPAEAARKMRTVLDVSKSDVNGSFFRHGGRIPW